MAAEEPLMTNFELQETEVEYKLGQALIDDIFKEVAEDLLEII